MISHLKIASKNLWVIVGLFGCLNSGAEVKNLGVVDVDITSSGSYVGGLVGQNYGFVAQCYSNGTVKGNNYVGGLVGQNYESLAQCYSSSVVSGSWLVGGLVGSNHGSVTQCYSTGSVNGTEDVGGLVGENQSLVGENWVVRICTVIQCYSTVKVSGTKNVGGLVGGHWLTEVSGSFWDIQTSGQITSKGGIGKTTAEMQDPNTFMAEGWDFVFEIKDGTHDVWQMPEEGGYPVLAILTGNTPLKLQGKGTYEDPYLISNVMELGAMIYYSPYAYYRLSASIDLSGIYWGSAVIAPDIGNRPSFAGVFNGNGHMISHLTINGGNYLGLFGRLDTEAEVRELSVVDVNITGSRSYVGGMVGYNSGGIVDQCFSTGTVRGNSYVGGLVGESSGSVTQCYSTCEVNGKDYIGGLAGYNRGSVTQCYSIGSVHGNKSVGGLVGMARGPNVTASFWDIQTSGRTGSYGGGTGKKTSEMYDPNTFLDAGWDFVDESVNGTEDIWWIDEGQDYPHLWWELIEDNINDPNEN